MAQISPKRWISLKYGPFFNSPWSPYYFPFWACLNLISSAFHGLASESFVQLYAIVVPCNRMPASNQRPIKNCRNPDQYQESRNTIQLLIGCIYHSENQSKQMYTQTTRTEHGCHSKIHHESTIQDSNRSTTQIDWSNLYIYNYKHICTPSVSFRINPNWDYALGIIKPSKIQLRMSWPLLNADVTCTRRMNRLIE